MGSIAGRSSLPFLGAYAMSKFALEAMADALRVELAPWGMHVAIVEPGDNRNADLDEAPTVGRRAADGGAGRCTASGSRRFRRAAAERSSKRAAPVDTVADAVEHALTAAKPKTRYPRRARREAARAASSGFLTAPATALLSRFLFGK